MDAPSRKIEMKMARRRGGQIMALFYRMLAVYFWTERVQVRAHPAPDEQAAYRQAMWTRLGAMYREKAGEMGGLLIKIGQLLSARADIFPPEFTTALKGLQDEVPGVPFEDIKKVVEGEFGKPLAEVFGSFDSTPLAAASLGQVHRATLPDGQPVVVKVLRPRVDTLIRADIEGFRQVVRFLLRWTSWAKGLDFAGIFYESYHILLRELDLRDEARHTKRFYKMFENEPSIAIPRVYEDFTRQRVLTLSYMDGVKLTDHEAMAAAGIDRREVAKLMISALGRQVLSEGFFHADPHPGNLLVQPGPVLVLLDFGMVGQLTPRHRSAFKRVGFGLLGRDPDMMLQGLDELEMLRPTADRQALRRAIAWLMEKQLQGNLFELRPEQFLEVARELRQIFYSQAFQFPSDIAFLGRGAGTTMGVCRTLDPEGDFIASVEGAVRQHLDPTKETTSTLSTMASDLARLPARFDRVLTAIEKGNIGMGMAPSEPTHRNGVGWVLPGFAAVMVVSGNQWWSMNHPGIATLCWVACGLAIVIWGLRRLPPKPSEP